MIRAPRNLLPLLLCGAVGGACGTQGDETLGASYVPTSGAGPFRRLPADPMNIRITAPFVLDRADVDLGDPSLVADGDRLSLWVTLARKTGSSISRADTAQLEDGFGALDPVLAADAAWEGASVSAPSVIPGSPWLMVYAAGGALGVAASADGKSWTKSAGPALTADHADEGDALGPPAALRLGDSVRVFYPAGGALWAAEAPFADLAAGRAATWTRLDGQPGTPGRDPMIARPVDGAIGRASARTVQTPAGRARHDLYFTRIASDLTPSLGFASSYTGDTYTVSPTAILVKPAASSPSVATWGDEDLMLFVAHSSRPAIAAALSP